MNKSVRTQGVFYALIAAFAFGFMPIFASIAYKGGTNPVTVVFLRFVFSSIILLAYFIIRRIDFRISRDIVFKVIILGVVGYAATCVMLYMAYQYIAVGLATIIHFVYPAIVTILAFIIYKEKLNYRKLFSLFLSIIGVYILIGFSSIRLHPLGIVLSIVSGLFYSFYILEIGHSDIRNINSLVLAFYVSLFSSIGTFGFGYFTKTLDFQMEVYSVIAIAATAIICTIIALIAFANAIKMIGSTNAAILSTLEPITSMIFSAILFREQISFNTIIGSFFILLSVYFIVKIPKKQTSIL